MRDRVLLRRRLSQYSALWVGGFLLVLIVAAAANLVAGLDLIDLSDWLLPAAFVVLGAALAWGVGATAISRAGLATKSLVAALAVLLALPLLWAPVLAVLVVAAIGGVTIEYSTAYAGFRIVVSHLVYPLIALFSESPLVAAAWTLFQVAASVVGFVASMVQVWKAVRGFLVGDDEEGDVEAV